MATANGRMSTGRIDLDGAAVIQRQRHHRFVCCGHINRPTPPPGLGHGFGGLFALRARSVGPVSSRQAPLADSRSWVKDALVAVLATAVVALVVMYLIGTWYTGQWNLFEPKTPKKGEPDIPWVGFIRVATPVVTLLVAVVAAVLAGHGHTTRLQEHQLSKRSADDDAYTKAIEQLGNPAVSVRLGGIYALEAHATATPSYLRPVDQVLVAHVRLVIERLGADKEHAMHWAASGAEEYPRIPSGIRLTDSGAEVAAALGALARLKVTARSAAPADNHRPFDLSSIRWIPLFAEWGQPLNFTGANLEGADFVNADLPHADLSEANLKDANLAQADITDANFTGANLKGAVFAGSRGKRADFTDADLTGAVLPRATR